MKRCLTLLAAAAFASPAFAESPIAPAPGPFDPPVVAANDPPLAPSSDPTMGQPFRSRVDGIQFRPPAGGTKLHEVNSGEIVRYVYPARAWDLRVKPIITAKPLALTTDPAYPDVPGLLDLTVKQLTDRPDASADVLRKDVVDVGKYRVGLIEARCNAGIDRVFTQQAIFRFNDRNYFLVQLVSPGLSKDPAKPGAGGLPQEAEARRMFQRVLASVDQLDRSQVRREQDTRLTNTRLLWTQLDQRALTAALQPVRLMRIVRDGKDVGYVQVNERLASQGGHDGIEVIVRSHVEVAPAATGPQAAPAAPPVDASTVGIDLPTNQPVGAGPATPTSQATKMDQQSNFFMTFDRTHEDWTTVTRPDAPPNASSTEIGTSDMQFHRALVPRGVATHAPADPDAKQPAVAQREDYLLNVGQYALAQKGQPVQRQLLWFYMPQAIGQLLPRLLPATDPKGYMFAFYVGAQHEVMARYVDVGRETNVELDGQHVRAVPIEDRVGLDGTATVHYVTRDNHWLGSVNADQKLEVFPTDENTLAGLWKDFKLLPEPPAHLTPVAPTYSSGRHENSLPHPAPLGR